MRKLTVFILSFACFVASAEAVPTYRIHDLGDLPGGQNRSFAVDINNAGWIVGEGGAAGGPRAVLWKRKPNGSYRLLNLGVLRDQNSSIANGINADNVIVGRSSLIGDLSSRKAVRWIPRVNGRYVARGLGTLGSNCAGDVLPGTEAFSINNAGWIVGQDDDCSFVWMPGAGMTPLFQGIITFERLVDINNDKSAVGTRYGPSGCCGPRPVAWNTAQRTMADLPVDSSIGYARGYAEGINSKGWIVGQLGDFIFGCCDTEAVLWKPTVGGSGYTATVLGPPEHLPGAFTKEAVGLDINRSGEVVGSVQSWDPMTEKIVKVYAFYWDETSGFRNLNDLVAARDPLKGKFRLLRAYAINDRGLIVGYGLTPRNKFHAFLLTRQ